jgi:hypothetical protein
MPPLGHWDLSAVRTVQQHTDEPPGAADLAPLTNEPGADSSALIGPALEAFDPISLVEMEGVQLMDRLDTKYTFRLDELPAILESMLPHYRLLDIQGTRASHYETLYFDTRRLNLYARHHSGIYPRYKLRYRKYVESDLCFFEVKAKTNQGRTIKQRIRDAAVRGEILGPARELLTRLTPLLPEAMAPSLGVAFTRLTFVSRSTPERLTIDVDLSYRDNDKLIAFPKLVIAELKQDRSAQSSPFLNLMRERRIWEGSMSKYCFGIINLHPEVKMNRFKPRLRELSRLAS